MGSYWEEFQELQDRALDVHHQMVEQLLEMKLKRTFGVLCQSRDMFAEFQFGTLSFRTQVRLQDVIERDYAMILFIFVDRASFDLPGNETTLLEQRINALALEMWGCSIYCEHEGEIIGFEQMESGEFSDVIIEARKRGYFHGRLAVN